MTLSALIKLRRLELKMSQEELAFKLGITQGLVSKYEHGMKIPADIFLSMVRIFKLKVNKRGEVK